MAKAKTLEDAIDEVLKDYNKVLEEAIKYASDIAVKDIYAESMSCLDEYYDNYDPTSYNRTDNLWRAIVPYLQIKNTKNSIKSTVGVEYDSSVLNMYHGSEKYNPTDGDWVLKNYLKGIHPATNGGTTTETTFYYENIDAVSPEQKMQSFLNEYYNTFNGNVFMYFVSEVGKKL